MKPRRDGKSYWDSGVMGYRKITEDEKRVYNYGLQQAQFHVWKVMMALGPDMPPETRKILKIIHEEIEKELK